VAARALVAHETGAPHRGHRVGAPWQRAGHRRECDRLREWMRYSHYDAIRFLTDRWSVIVASNVRFQRLMGRQGRVIDRWTVRRLQGCPGVR
jgi:hypothetical protein